MASGEIPSTAVATFGRMSARRLLILGGIALVAGGMFLGDIFAVFFLHQNGRLQGEALIAATPCGMLFRSFFFVPARRAPAFGARAVAINVL